MDSEKFQKFCSVKRYATFHTNFLKLKNIHRKKFRRIQKNSKNNHKKSESLSKKVCTAILVYIKIMSENV